MIARALAVAVVWCCVLLAIGMPAPADAGHTGRHVTGAGWSVRWDVTPTDGLAVEAATYAGRTVLQRVSVPQCLVRYYAGTPTMKDQMGTSGNIRYVGGSLNVTRTSDALILSAVFDCCGYPNAGSYRYRVRYVFYDDGDWRPSVYVFGPGLEGRAVYECHIRMDHDLGGGANDFFEYHDQGWRRPAEERGVDVRTTDDQGNAWRVFDAAGWGYGIDPRSSDGSVSMYILRANDGEGGGDLSSYRVPSSFNGDQAVQNVDNVQWYWSRTPYSRPSGCPGSGCSRNPKEVGPTLERIRRVIG